MDLYGYGSVNGIYGDITMTIYTECPHCKSTNIENYIPGPDDGQGGYWPRIYCKDCHTYSDGRVKCYETL